MEDFVFPLPPSQSNRRGFSQTPSAQPTTVLAAYPHRIPYVYSHPATGPKVAASEYLIKCRGIIEDTANSIWQHVKTGPNIINTTLGRLSLGRKVLMGGGFEHVFIHRFGSLPNEKLVDAYTCFLSSSAGPIAGTLFITTERIVFGSDWSLPYHPAPRETMWSYYHVDIPVDKVKLVNATTNVRNHFEKYIQIVTIESLEFWYMGFMNHEKAFKCIQEVRTRSLA